MILRRLILLLCMSAAFVSQGSAQNDCPLITESELGSTAAHSNVGVIPVALQESGDGGTAQPFLLIRDFQITCTVAGNTPETFRYLSIVVFLNCADQNIGLPCASSPLGSDGDFTVQIELRCGATGWQRGTPVEIVGTTIPNTITVPANGNLDTVPDGQCAHCINNRLRDVAIVLTVPYNNKSHCIFCNEECLNVGLGQCTSLGADECCPFYHDAGMGFQCVSSCPENFVANASFFCIRTCANLTDPADGQVTYSPSDTPRFVGTVATYSCEQGFDVVEGDMERTCQSDGTWTGSEPSCQRFQYSCYQNETCINFLGNAEVISGCCSEPLNGCFYTDRSGVCQTCKNDSTGVGGDPHFSIVLNDGNMLCYSVQGRNDSVFNLISCSTFVMNANFVPDSKRPEVTWMGTIGVVLGRALHYKHSRVTGFKFDSKKHAVHIGKEITLPASALKEISSENGSISIIRKNDRVSASLHPAVKLHLKDVGLHFTIKYENGHLDMIWHNPISGSNCHGLIGQFFHKGIEVDEVRKILVMPNKPPVPVEWKPVWRFMERRAPRKDEQHCWKAMNPGLQGKGLIDGHYLDYLVGDVLSSGFQFESQH